MSLYRLDELEGQPVAHLHGACIDDQDIEIDNYQFSADYLQDAASGKVVEETLVSHLLKSNCLITHQPDWGSVQIQYRGAKIDREKLLRYGVLPSPQRISRAVRRAHLQRYSAFLSAGSPFRLCALHATRRSGHQPVAQQHRFCSGHRSPRSSIVNIFTICVR